MGQAAGAAAAMAAAAGGLPRAIDVAKLRDCLLESGALLSATDPANPTTSSGRG